MMPDCELPAKFLNSSCRLARRQDIPPRPSMAAGELLRVSGAALAAI